VYHTPSAKASCAPSTASFTALEIDSVTSQPTPDQVNALPVITSNSVFHYIRKARKGVAPGFDKLRNEHVETLSDCYNPIPSADALLYISHLTSFLNLIRSGTLPKSIIAVCRDGHLISIPNSPTDDRPIVLASIYRKWSTVIPLQSLIPDLQLSFQHLQFGISPRGTEAIIHSVNSIMHSHPDYDVYFADGINAFNSVSRTATLLQVKELYGEAFSFFFQFYADTLHLWHTIDPSHISSIDSDEGFQKGDPASTTLYCIDIQPFIKQLQQFLLAQGPALPSC
jgi:hypothetical protein